MQHMLKLMQNKTLKQYALIVYLLRDGLAKNIVTTILRIVQSDHKQILHSRFINRYSAIGLGDRIASGSPVFCRKSINFTILFPTGLYKPSSLF